MGRLRSLIMLCIMLILIFSGCYDIREIDDVAHVLAIGVDRGVSDKWRLTLQFASLNENSGNGQQEGDGSSGGGAASESGGGQDGYTYVTVDAPSFFTGIDMLNSSVPRRLVFTHASLIVLSEELSKDDIVGDYIAPIIRFREVRRTAHMVVTKGSALDYIRANQPFIGTTLAKALQTAATESTNTGYFLHTTLSDFYNQLKSTCGQPVVTMAAVNEFRHFKEKGSKWGNEFNTGGQYLAGQLPRQGQNKIEYWGTALFDQGKMVDELNGQETRTLAIIRGEFERGFFTLQDPKEPKFVIPLDVRPAGRPKVKISFNGDTPTIDLTIHLKGDILAVQSRLHYEQDPLLSLLENTFKKNIKSEVDQLINRCKNLNLDVFKFGDVAARKFWTIDEWEKYNWNKHFKDTKVNTQVEFVIRSTGTQMKSSPIPGTEEED
ncbi:MAG: Ger(x)C family spore germination protein [Clostridiales bacterium]|nr:Ger(x)C family spore germination protein [Clostridiales bacterium]